MIQMGAFLVTEINWQSSANPSAFWMGVILPSTWYWDSYN
jgi:hypothetical protein